MATGKPLTPRGAVAMGLAVVACGVPPILIGMGVMHPSPGDAPGWIGILAGLVFVCGGLAVVLDYAIAHGPEPDGDLPPDTPLFIRGANYLLGLTIIGLMAIIAGWVAFGPGPRRFSASILSPLLSQRWQSGELSGRIAFGLGTILLVFMFIVCGLAGIRRLRPGQKP